MDSLNTSNPDYYEDGIRFGTRPELIAQIKKLQEELATAKSTESDRLLEEMEGSLESVDMGIAFMPPTTSHEYAKGCNDNLEEVRRVLSEVFDTSETREPCLLNRLDKIANRFLWGVHFIGPDEIWAAESYAAAVRLAKQHNQHFISSMETTDVAVIAAPTPWIGEPEDHAMYLEKQSEETSKSRLQEAKASLVETIKQTLVRDTGHISNPRIVHANSFDLSQFKKQESGITGVEFEYVDQHGPGFSGDDYWGTMAFPIGCGQLFLIDFSD